jgi:hypothetical protein
MTGPPASPQPDATLGNSSEPHPLQASPFNNSSWPWLTRRDHGPNGCICDSGYGPQTYSWGPGHPIGIALRGQDGGGGGWIKALRFRGDDRKGWPVSLAWPGRRHHLRCPAAPPPSCPPLFFTHHSRLEPAATTAQLTRSHPFPPAEASFDHPSRSVQRRGPRPSWYRRQTPKVVAPCKILSDSTSDDASALPDLLGTSSLCWTHLSVARISLPLLLIPNSRQRSRHPHQPEVPIAPPRPWLVCSRDGYPTPPPLLLLEEVPSGSITPASCLLT